MRIAALVALSVVPVSVKKKTDLACPYVIEGRVTDQAGSPLQEAIISIVGTNLLGAPNANGNYRLRLSCPQRDSVVQVRFRRIGYKMVTRPVTLGRDSVVRL